MLSRVTVHQASHWKAGLDQRINQHLTQLLDEDIQTTDSDDPSFFPKPIAGGKKYTKKRKLSINTNSCTLADRRHTSIRQQSDQILAVVGGSIAASPATVYSRREEVRLFSLKECESAVSESRVSAVTS